MSTSDLPPEPGVVTDLDHGLIVNPCPEPADEDDSDELDGPGVNDYED